mmetsp:Transcript_17643/g.36754  ORF Transcript_17643/g.36754 Transcript_17643/m.36754 type:complete len:251 (+) Transcript_17643:77-829(+)
MRPGVLAGLLAVAITIHGCLAFQRCPSPNVTGCPFFRNDSIVHFSGSKYEDSQPGFIYSVTNPAPVQYGRLYYRMDRWPPPSLDSDGRVSHITLVALGNGLREGVLRQQEIRIADAVLNVNSGHVQYLLNIDATDWSQTSPHPLEFNVETDYAYSFSHAWTCVEWVTNSSSGTVEMFLNGSALPAYSATSLTFTRASVGTMPPGLENVSFSFPERDQSLVTKIGFYTYNDLFVSGALKNVVMAAERIGCD